MHNPVKVLLNAVNVESRNGEWRRPIGTDYEKEQGFFRPTWYRYQPHLGTQCLVLRLVNKNDGSSLNMSGVVYCIDFDDQLDYIELSVGVPQYRWDAHWKFFTPDQGWLHKQNQYEWPAPPTF